MKIGDNVFYVVFDRFRGEDTIVYAKVVDKVGSLFVTENSYKTKNFLYEYQLEKSEIK